MVQNEICGVWLFQINFAIQVLIPDKANNLYLFTSLALKFLSIFVIFWLADYSGRPHIDRVSNRTKFTMGKNVVEVEQKLLQVVPKEFKVDIHHWLILHGRYTCTAHKPKCGSCIIENLCELRIRLSKFSLFRA